MDPTACCHTDLKDEDVHGNQLNPGGFRMMYMDMYTYPPNRSSEVDIACYTTPCYELG